MVQENRQEVMDGVDSFKGHDEVQCVNFSCSIPMVTGRGFIEVLLPSVSHLNPVLFLSLSLINASFESIIR
jgi:hypothetical protein